MVERERTTCICKTHNDYFQYRLLRLVRVCNQFGEVVQGFNVVG